MTLSHIAGCRGIRDIAGLMQQLGAGEEDKPQKKEQKKDASLARYLQKVLG